MKRGTVVIGALLAGCFLAACAAAPDSVQRDGVRMAAGGTLDVEGQEPLEGSDQTASGRDEVSDAPSGEDAEPEEDADMVKNAEKESVEILSACAGRKVVKSIPLTGGKELMIDAEVNVEGVGRVSQYRYILEPVTEEIRQNLFQSIFTTRASEMTYDERNDVWELRNSPQGGDYWLYQISFANGGTTIPGEEIIMLEYRYYDLYPFEDNRLRAVSDSRAAVSAEDAAEACRRIVDAAAGTDDFEVDYIHAYGTGGRRPYYKIVFKRMLDGMPVTTYNNLSFLYDNDGLEKVWGSLFSQEEIGLEAPILTVEEAVASLERQAVYLDFGEKEQISVSEVALEYVTLMSPAGDILIVPVWRFRLGEDADERNYLREKILAVHAVMGDFIWEERGNTF